MCNLLVLLKKMFTTSSTGFEVSEEQKRKIIINDLIKQYEYTCGSEPIESFKADIALETFRKLNNCFECRGCGVGIKEEDLKETCLFEPSDEDFYIKTYYKHILCVRLYNNNNIFKHRPDKDNKNTQIKI